MQVFLTTLLQCSVSMSLITLLYMAVLPLLSRRYAAKWRYIVWLVIAAGWICPFRPRVDLSFLPMQMPDIPVTPVQPIINAIPSMTDTGDMVNTPGTIPLWLVLAAIWILGVASVVLYHALRHGRFMKMVRRWSEPVTDLESLEILDSLKLELEIKTQVGLSVCQSITSPMLVGFFRPAILLPPVKIADYELSLILKHELIHFQRHDLWYKVLILAATALHWFNPVAYLMAKATAVQCEISCDALVLQGADFQQRKQYGETIIGVVRNGAKLRTALSTNFYGGKRGMKNRISSIMDTKRKKAGVAILCIVLVGVIMTGAILAAAATDDSIASASITANNQTRLISTDNGKTWMSEEEFEKAYPTPEVVWWTYDEYKKWLDNEKIQLQSMIGGRGWNPTDSWYVWTQERVDKTIKMYEDLLDDIKNGMKLSKTVNGSNEVVMASNPSDIAKSSGYEVVIANDKGVAAQFGPYDTKEELLVQLRPYCDEQVKAGNMTQQEADEILSKYK
jgi:beta-lactamase regulating signal transducer with metallopeptidase domain